MLKKGGPTRFGDLSDRSQAAFVQLKSKFALPVVLYLSRPGRSNGLETYVCDIQFEPALIQPDDDMEWRPVRYWSRELCPTERNYDTTKREFLAIVWNVLLLRPCLQHDKFLVRTDHLALRWVFHVTKFTGQLARWVIHMVEYYFKVMQHPNIVHQAPTLCPG